MGEVREGERVTATNRERLRASVVDLSTLHWFLRMAPESALDDLPPSARFLPG